MPGCSGGRPGEPVGWAEYRSACVQSGPHGPAPTPTRLLVPSASTRSLSAASPAWAVLRLAGLSAAAVLLAAALGRALVIAPLPTTGLVLLAFLAAVTTTAPRAALLLGIGTFAISLEKRFGLPYPELTKGLVVLLAAPFVLLRGLDPRRLVPLGGYLVLAVLTVLAASKLPGLTNTQIASSFVSLTIAWTLFAVRYRQEDVARIVPLIALLPLISLVAGLVLYPMGRGGIVVLDNGAPRLAGGTIAPYLAMLGCIGATAALVWHRMLGARYGAHLAAANGLIVVFTLSRGALLAAIVLFAPAVYRLFRTSGSTRPETHLLKIGAAVAALCVVVAAAAPMIESRNVAAEDSVNQRDSAFNTSGRLDAWSEFYAIAQVNPLFGRGLGAGPIAQPETDGFKAQHNEYVRLLLEGGWIGGSIVLLAIVTTLVHAVRRAPRVVRPDLTALVLGFLVLSTTDNTLSAPAFAVPFALLVGALAAVGPAAAGRLPRVSRGTA